MLHVIFEVNKVRIVDKTSQSSEHGGGGLKNRQQNYTESSTMCRGVSNVTKTHKNTCKLLLHASAQKSDMHTYEKVSTFMDNLSLYL